MLCRSVAEDFVKNNGSSDDAVGKVIWTFEFEHLKCHHVNFIMHTAAPREKEFLLPPYTVLELKHVERSKDLTLKEHRITVKVANDNKDPAHPKNLPLAPWI